MLTLLGPAAENTICFRPRENCMVHWCKKKEGGLVALDQLTSPDKHFRKESDPGRPRLGMMRFPPRGPIRHISLALALV
jgi:hypothetical protein